MTETAPAVDHAPATTDDHTHYVCCRFARTTSRQPRYTHCGLDATGIPDGQGAVDCGTCLELARMKADASARTGWGPCAHYCPESFFEEPTP